MAERTYLTEEELNRLLGQVSSRYITGKRNLALLTLMADAGLRVSEAVGLETRDLEREGGQLTSVLIRNGKGGRPGRMPLTRRAAAKLGAWLKEREKLGVGNGAVFCTITKGNRGKPISRHYVYQVLRRLADRADIEKKVGPHTLRHTFANRLLKRGRNLAQVQKAMRHRSITTTVDIYGHLDTADVEEAVAALNQD